MRYETPDLDESLNPNIPKHQAHHELWQMLRYIVAFIAIVWLFVESVVLALPYILSLEREKVWFDFIEHQFILNEHTKPNPELQQLADKLSQNMGLQQGTVKVYIQQNSEMNAFATFGGHIVMYQGLLNHLENEQAVASVLAHEIAHIKHRDPLRHSSRSLLFTLILTSFISDEIAIGLQLVEGSHYSRQLEQNADLVSVDTLYKTYGQVGGAIQAFQTLKQSNNETTSLSWLQSHPQTLERIDYIQHYAQTQHYPLSSSHQANIWKHQTDK